jgi:hypothetical protein
LHSPRNGKDRHCILGSNLPSKRKGQALHSRLETERTGIAFSARTCRCESIRVRCATGLRTERHCIRRKADGKDRHCILDSNLPLRVNPGSMRYRPEGWRLTSNSWQRRRLALKLRLVLVKAKPLGFDEQKRKEQKRKGQAETERTGIAFSTQAETERTGIAFSTQTSRCESIRARCATGLRVFERTERTGIAFSTQTSRCESIRARCATGLRVFGSRRVYGNGEDRH